MFHKYILPIGIVLEFALLVWLVVSGSDRYLDIFLASFALVWFSCIFERKRRRDRRKIIARLSMLSEEPGFISFGQLQKIADGRHEPSCRYYSASTPQLVCAIHPVDTNCQNCRDYAPIQNPRNYD